MGRAIAINLMGTVYREPGRAAHFKAQRPARSSTCRAAARPIRCRGISAYAASKAAVVRFTETLALEVRGARHRRQCDCARRARDAADSIELLAAGPEKVGQDFLRRMISRPEEEGGTPLERGRRALRLSCVGRERRHHRQAASRRCGIPGRFADSI